MMKVKADIGGVGGAAIADAAPEALGEDDDGEDPDVVASGDIIKEVAEDNDDHCGGAASENDIDTEGAVTPADHEKDTIVAVLAERPEEEDPTAGAATALPGIEEFSMEVVDSVAKSQYELQLKSWTSLAKAQSVSKEVPPRSGKMSLLAWEIDVDGKKALHVGYIHWVSDPKKKRKKADPVYGREVVLDNKCNVVFSVPSAWPLIDLKNTPFLILAGDIGVKMEKVREHERPPMDKDMLHLHNLYGNALDMVTATAAGAAGALAGALCFLCKRPSSSDEPLQHCAVCCCAWHAPCMACVLAHVVRVAAPNPVPTYKPKGLADEVSGSLTIPNKFFGGHLCHLCKHSDLFKIS
jgi:hypothetical protein